MMESQDGLNALRLGAWSARGVKLFVSHRMEMLLRAPAVDVRTRLADAVGGFHAILGFLAILVEAFAWHPAQTKSANA